MSKPHNITPISFPSDATLDLPGSKSEANRLLVAAALTGEKVTIHGATPSEDVRHLVAGLTTLGFSAAFINEPRGIIRVGPRRPDAPTSGELFCGNAGTALRFLVSVAAITPGDWTITGDLHMQKRPIQPLVDAWQKLGVAIEATQGCPPVRVKGGTSRGGSVTIDSTVSSQFASSLFLVGAALPDGLTVDLLGPLASRSYGELTCIMLRRLSVDAKLDNNRATINGTNATPTAQHNVAGDWSSMGIWSCLNHLTGSKIVASNLNANSGQADEQLVHALNSLSENGEQTIDVKPIPDQFLNLAVVAAFRKGTTHLTGAANVRVKECDRVAVMARELKKIGVDLDEHHDGLTIRGGMPMRGAIIDPEDDHRVAIAFALAGLLSPGIAIENPECVAKSYPTFWGDVARVSAQHRPIAIVGMRAAGKTSLGRSLSETNGNTFIDTDQRFVEKHGPIADFVAKHGWPAFRAEEERIIIHYLQPGNIIATGGGAIESGATRSALGDRAFVIWVRAKIEFLRARLAHDQKRPSITGAPVTAEIAAVLAKREPHYSALANLIVESDQSRPEQLEFILQSVQERPRECPDQDTTTMPGT